MDGKKPPLDERIRRYLNDADAEPNAPRTRTRIIFVNGVGEAVVEEVDPDEPRGRQRPWFKTVRDDDGEWVQRPVYRGRRRVRWLRLG
jgi:hypothetical protein